MHQAGVDARQPAGNLAARTPSEKADVLRVALGQERLQCSEPCAVAQDHESKPVEPPVAGQPSSLDDHFETVRQAHGADVPDEEVALSSSGFLANRLVGIGRQEHGSLDAIGDDADLLSGHAPFQKLGSVAITHSHDVVRGEVQTLLEPLEVAHRNASDPRPTAAPKSPDGLDRFRPDVANLEHEGAAFQACHPDTGPAAKELRAGGDHEVGTWKS